MSKTDRLTPAAIRGSATFQEAEAALARARATSASLRKEARPSLAKTLEEGVIAVVGGGLAGYGQSRGLSDVVIAGGSGAACAIGVFLGQPGLIRVALGALAHLAGDAARAAALPAPALGGAQ